MGYVLSHIDDRLKDPVGEGQRKEGVPPEAELIRRGLVALDAVARQRHQAALVDCDVQQQFAILASLQIGGWSLSLSGRAYPKKTCLPSC